MKEKMICSIVRVAGFGILITILLTVANANAQCGGAAFDAMMAAASTGGRSKVLQPRVERMTTPGVVGNDRVNPSIVGLWHIKFFVDTPGGPVMIQEAFQIWNTGGTEVHNPNVDPRGGSVCLGSWVQAAPLTFNLTHRVWLYDTLGHLHAIGHLTESLTLGDRGDTQGGTFTLQAFDPETGEPLGNPAVGTVVGERISPN